MEARAVVTGVRDGLAVVRVLESESGCGRCEEPGGCRSGMLARPLGSGCREYEVGNGIGARPGDCVVLGLPAGALRRAAARAYLLPLALLLAGGALGALAAPPELRDLGTLAGALAGVIAALVLNFFPFGRGAEARDAPILLRRFAPVDSTMTTLQETRS